MKKMIIAGVLFIAVLPVLAQHNPNRVNTYVEEPEGGNGFLKQNLFLGGSLNLGYSGYDFNVGGAPEIGYSLNRWIDAGVLVNLNYSSERADPGFYYNANIRQRDFTYGTGVFARFYPIRFLFLQVEPEYNWTKYSFKDMSSGETGSLQQQAASLLLGIGYGQRIVGRSNFYIALMFDALQNEGSPYLDFNRTPIPVIKAGFDIYLHPAR
jgi:hypothetical protein